MVNQTDKIRKQIYALEIKLLKGSNGNQNFPLIQKINNLRRELSQKQKAVAWQEYLSK